jgi:hypothetical protein
VVGAGGDNDTNLIKNLLAKKVCQNMVRHGGTTPPPNSENGLEENEAADAEQPVSQEQPQAQAQTAGLAQSHQPLQQQLHEPHTNLLQQQLQQPTLEQQQLHQQQHQQPHVQAVQQQQQQPQLQMQRHLIQTPNPAGLPQQVPVSQNLPVQTTAVSLAQEHVPAQGFVSQIQQHGQLPQQVVMQQKPQLVLQQQPQIPQGQGVFVQHQQPRLQLQPHTGQPQLQMQQPAQSVGQPPAAQTQVVMSSQVMGQAPQQMVHTIQQQVVQTSQPVQQVVQTSQPVQQVIQVSQALQHVVQTSQTTQAMGQPQTVHATQQVVHTGQPLQASQAVQPQVGQVIHAQPQVLQLPQGQVILHRPQPPAGQPIHIQPRMSSSVQSNVHTTLHIQPHQQIVLPSGQVLQSGQVLPSGQVQIRPQPQIIVQQQAGGGHVVIQGQPHVLHTSQALNSQLHLQAGGQPIRIQSAAGQQPVVIQLPMYQQVTVCPTSLVQTSAGVMPFRTIIPTQHPNLAPATAPTQTPVVGESVVSDSSRLATSALQSALNTPSQAVDAAGQQSALSTIPPAPALQTVFSQGVGARVISAPMSVASSNTVHHPMSAAFQRMPVVQSHPSTQSSVESQPTQQQQQQQHIANINNNGHYQNVNGGKLNKECNGLQVNGIESSDSDMVPSPLDGTKVSSEHLFPNGELGKVSKDSLAEKAAKLNGVVRHLENGGVEKMEVEEDRSGSVVRTEGAESVHDNKCELWQVNGQRPSPATTPSSLPPRDNMLVKQASVEEASLDSTDIKGFVNGKGLEAVSAVGRQLFSPEGSHDSDLSCDSFASAADSVNSDKHSMTSSSFARPPSAASFMAPPSPCPSTSSTTASSFPDIPLVLAGTIPMSEAMEKKSKKKATPAKPKAPTTRSSKKKKGSASTSTSPMDASPSATPPPTPITMQYMCEWHTCRRLVHPSLYIIW